MRDGIALGEVLALNSVADLLEDPVGESLIADVYPVLERSGARAVLPAGAANRPVASSAAVAGVFAAAEQGGDVAAGGWFAWQVGGTECPTGTECSTVMRQSLRSAGRARPDLRYNIHCAANIALTGPACLAYHFDRLYAAIASMQEWAATMQGWWAVSDYRSIVRGQAIAQLSSSLGPDSNWSTFAGRLPDIEADSYISPEDAVALQASGGLPNPVCVVPDTLWQWPTRGIEREDDTIAYAAENEVGSEALWDPTGLIRDRPGITPDDFLEWPPRDALRNVVIDPTLEDTVPPELLRSCSDSSAGPPPAICGSLVPAACSDFPEGGVPTECSQIDPVTGALRTHVQVAVQSYRRMVPGLYTGNEEGGFRRVFYGDPGRDGSDPLGFDPESYDFFGMSSVATLDDVDLPARFRIPVDDLPRTMVEGDHLHDIPPLNSSPGPGGVVFRELSCPAVDAPGSYGTARPLVCSDGRVWFGWLMPDHMTPCSSGEERCAERIFAEPVFATGGGGSDPTSVTWADMDYGVEPAVVLFGRDFRHVCDVSAGRPTNPGDGRVDLQGVVHAESTPLPHGHDPEEGYYPAVREYPDQNCALDAAGDPTQACIAGGFLRRFDPFAAYDNYGSLFSAGDQGRDGLLSAPNAPAAAQPVAEDLRRHFEDVDLPYADGGLFTPHLREARVTNSRGGFTYDEFETVPYQVRDRATVYQLWAESRVDRRPNYAGSDLFWGWPSLDVQDDPRASLTQMRESRMRTEQQLFGVVPGAEVAEQVWLRNEGPLSFFGATRVGNAMGDGKGGCLMQPFRPGTPGAQRWPARPVLDPITEAWCVMHRDVEPIDSCVTWAVYAAPPSPPVVVTGTCWVCEPSSTVWAGTGSCVIGAGTCSAVDPVGGALCHADQPTYACNGGTISDPVDPLTPPEERGQCYYCPGGDSEWEEWGACELGGGGSCFRGTCMAEAPTSACGDASPE